MKRYIGNTGEVHIIEDDSSSRQRAGGRAESSRSAIFEELESVNTSAVFDSLRRPFSGLNFNFDAGDLAVLALLFFLYRESGDEEFLIILAFFAFGILTK